MADEDEVEPDPRDVSDPKAVKRKAATKQFKDREDERFFRETLLGSEAGRRFLWSILMQSMAFNPPFMSSPAGFPDSKATWFQLGKRELGLALYQSWLLGDPLAIAQMHAENDPRFAKK